ncbi:dsRBD fold-containing protein [Streptomyces sp. NPDC059740]|uniref:dsRBD fold-containing protein n=1 Tax=Streptomyces sp. NPDC059740 TaxID=3346926 RepID=UPI003661BFF5
MDRVTQWSVHVYLFEHERSTTARAELDTGTSRITGHGTAHRAPQDAEVPEIGDEIAAGRALQELGRRLLAFADEDLSALATPGTRTPVHHSGHLWTDE